MPNIVADDLERKFCVDEALDAGVPERMGACPPYRDPGLAQIESCSLRDGAGAQWQSGGQSTEE